MRQSISSVLAALAAVTVSAVPALACGYGPCTPYTPAYAYAPAYTYMPAYGGCTTGCNTGWAFEHLAEPATQYYYVNQGPTYTGPGAFAPVPTYQESAVSGWDGYRTQPYYRWHHHHPYHSYRWHGYHYGMTPYHRSPRYGYMPYYYGHRVLRRYY
ncbi:hypothetical protein [Bradyrhizobium sp.]|uniref:hypothetical protein n=1 Tax=Bradyrhizobium sp. TaxID=376 RepID=UPI001EC220DC|nr:hypothetical protein [Bradyrhizobium sp.]MBV8918833.1 hypothetical protein [Bradyrhizobium sp.]MBV9979252.1 hypothetical protein [Bradyrhizobium sp.]